MNREESTKKDRKPDVDLRDCQGEGSECYVHGDACKERSNVGAIPCLRDNGQWRCDGRAVISDQPAASWHAACLSAASFAVVRLPTGMDAKALTCLGELLTDEHHVIQFANQGWTIAHPLMERLDGSLFDCDVVWDGDDPGLRGRFNLEYDEDGVLVLGARAEDTP